MKKRVMSQLPRLIITLDGKWQKFIKYLRYPHTPILPQNLSITREDLLIIAGDLTIEHFPSSFHNEEVKRKCLYIQKAKETYGILGKFKTRDFEKGKYIKNFIEYKDNYDLFIQLFNPDNFTSIRTLYLNFFMWLGENEIKKLNQSEIALKIKKINLDISWIFEKINEWFVKKEKMSDIDLISGNNEEGYKLVLFYVQGPSTVPNEDSPIYFYSRKEDKFLIDKVLEEKKMESDKNELKSKIDKQKRQINLLKKDLDEIKKSISIIPQVIVSLLFDIEYFSSDDKKDPKDIDIIKKHIEQQVQDMVSKKYYPDKPRKGVGFFSEELKEAQVYGAAINFINNELIKWHGQGLYVPCKEYDKLQKYVFRSLPRMKNELKAIFQR